MSEWQLIETAPRDGTAILATNARVMDWTLVVFWDVEREQMTDRESHGHLWHDAGDGPIYHRDSFTHWMPLPKPPTDWGIE